MVLDILVRIGGGLLGGYAAYGLTYLLLEGFDPGRRNLAAWGAAALAGAVAIWLTDRAMARPLAAFRRSVQSMPLQDLVVAVAGLFVGLVLAALAAIPLSLLPELLGRSLPLVSALIFAYAGITVALARRREILALAPRWLRAAPAEPGERPEVLVDTSAIIDGRIADVAAAGFIPGSLLVPRFVLAELQHIADSADGLRRNRGRRGLDLLHRLQRDKAIPLAIRDVDAADVAEVDAKLVHLARERRCPIVTNDYNLNRVATLQGVKILNLNELANAVKVVALPGEEMQVRIVQDGKEPGQGIAFLEDGTMIVVDGGRRLRDRDIDVVVTRVIQTHAGRLIFASPKTDAETTTGQERFA